MLRIKITFKKSINPNLVLKIVVAIKKMQVVLRIHASNGLIILKIHKIYISVLNWHRHKFISIKCHATKIFGGT